MKKLFTLFLALLLLLSLAACGGDDGAASPDGTDGKVDAQDVIDQAVEDAEEVEAFSMRAVEIYLEHYGLKLADVEPEWEWQLANEYCAYGDDPTSGYGHAVVQFNTVDGELTDEQINDYFATVFAATAAASDDGYNVIGYEFVGEGEDALAETTLEDSLGGFMQGWAFRSGGTLMVVYVNTDYDNDKESAYDRIFYYNAVEVDIGVGLQKSFDDTWSEMEDYFEENEDAIRDALEDYTS